MHRSTWAALLIAAGLGCATVPTEQLVDAKVAIRSAREAGAAEEPTASRYLRLAEEEHALAQRHIEHGERRSAAEALLRAEADAELAMALAQEASAQRRAEEAQRRVRSVQPAAPDGTTPEERTTPERRTPERREAPDDLSTGRE